MTAAAAHFESTRAWSLGSDVALRPESFGALAYSFKTRRLTFLKSRELAELVNRLSEFDSADDAMDAIGIPTSRRSSYRHALAALAEKGMVVPRVSETAR